MVGVVVSGDLRFSAAVELSLALISAPVGVDSDPRPPTARGGGGGRNDLLRNMQGESAI